MNVRKVLSGTAIVAILMIALGLIGIPAFARNTVEAGSRRSTGRVETGGCTVR